MNFPNLLSACSLYFQSTSTKEKHFANDVGKVQWSKMLLKSNIWNDIEPTSEEAEICFSQFKDLTNWRFVLTSLDFFFFFLV